MFEICLAKGILGWNTVHNGLFGTAFTKAEKLRNSEDDHFNLSSVVNRSNVQPPFPTPLALLRMEKNRASVVNSWAPMSIHLDQDNIPLSPPQSHVSHEGGLDPYLHTTDVTGSNHITDLLENLFKAYITTSRMLSTVLQTCVAMATTRGIARMRSSSLLLPEPNASISYKKFLTWPVKMCRCSSPSRLHQSGMGGRSFSIR